MTTRAQIDQIIAKAEQIASVGGSLLSNASLLKKYAAALTPDPDPVPMPPTAAQVLWGAAVMPESGESYQQAFDRAQATLGRFQVARTYDNGGGPTAALKRASQINVWPQVISFKLDPAQVAAGQNDAELAAFFADTRVTYWCYYHECDQVGRPFTPAQFVTAWRHIRDLSKQSPNKNLRAVLILTGFDVVNRFPNFWPGDDQVDVFAVDTYLRKPADTAESVSRDAYQLAQQHGVKFGIGETGVQTDTFTIDQQVTGIQSMSWWATRCEFVCYFDVKDGSTTHSRIDDIPESAAAWRTLTD
jgi:hypothetical protein